MPGMQFTLMEGGIWWTALGDVAQLMKVAASLPSGACLWFWCAAGRTDGVRAGSNYAHCQ